MLSVAGDGVTITEQTLDGAAFYVTNQRSGESGKVPVDYIELGESLLSYIHICLSSMFVYVRLRVVILTTYSLW